MNNKKCLIIIGTYFLGYNFLYSIIASFLVALNRGNDDILMIGVYGIILLNFFLLAKRYLIEEFKKFISRFVSYILPIIKYFIINYIVMIGCSLVILFLFQSNNTANNIVIEETLQVMPYSTFFSAVIFAPIVEELVFRKCLFQVFYKKNKVSACIISSLLFGFIHVFSSLLVGNFADLVNILTYSAMGYVLSRAYIDNDNLFCSIGVHMLNNLIGMLVLL